MDIAIGTWIVPLVVTIAAFWVAVSKHRANEASGAYRGDYNFGAAIVGLLFGGGAVIVSLIVWLIWALFT